MAAPLLFICVVTAGVAAPVSMAHTSPKATRAPAGAAAERTPRSEASDRNKEASAEDSKEPPDSKPITFPEHATQVGLWSLIVGLALGLILYRLLRFVAERFPKDRFRIEWLWIGVGVVGAMGHALFVGTKVGDHWEPVFDTTTLLWVGVAGVGLIYPRISEVTLGTFGFKLQDAVKDVSDVVDKALNLTDKWASRLNSALAELPKLDGNALSIGVATFLREAAIDAITWMGDDGESRRLIYWIYNPETDELGLFLSPEITQESNPEIFKYRLRKGEGLLRKVLAWPPPLMGPDGSPLPSINRPTSLNVSNAKKEPGYFPIPGERSVYKGLLIAPIRAGDATLGVISVDRSLQDKFPNTSVMLIEALASMSGILLGEPTIRKKLGL
jgi:hypothetical protein